MFVLLWLIGYMLASFNEDCRARLAKEPHPVRTGEEWFDLFMCCSVVDALSLAGAFIVLRFLGVV